MQNIIGARWQKLMVLATMCAAFLAAFAGSALAYDYTKLTKPIEDELAIVVPILLGLLGLVLGLSWAIRFVVSKLRAAK